MRSSLEFSFMLAMSCFTCWHLVVDFFCGGFLWQKQTAQLSSTIPSLEHDGSPKTAGPGVSATYHWVCSQLVTFFPCGVQSM